jgi:hypothetical protein
MRIYSGDNPTAIRQRPRAALLPHPLVLVASPNQTTWPGITRRLLGKSFHGLTGIIRTFRLRPSKGSAGMREYFRRFLSLLPRRRGYCLDCLSRLYGEPPAAISGYLAENGLGGCKGQCGNCGQRTETFREDLEA